MNIAFLGASSRGDAEMEEMEERQKAMICFCGKPAIAFCARCEDAVCEEHAAMREYSPQSVYHEGCAELADLEHFYELVVE
jgi:hypothetical protein